MYCDISTLIVIACLIYTLMGAFTIHMARDVYNVDDSFGINALFWMWWIAICWLLPVYIAKRLGADVR